MSQTRAAFIACLQRRLQESPLVAAAWLGGADATGRIDALSDVDVQLVVSDDGVEAAFAMVESLLEECGGIAHRWRVPEPIWHGHSSAVYMLKEYPSSMCLDLLVIKRSSTGWLLQPERHGKIVPLVDPEGLLLQPEVDHVDHAKRRENLISEHRDSQPILQEVLGKTIARGHVPEGCARYHATMISTLVDLMRCEHCPDRFDFGIRYLDRDLPEDEQALLESLSMVGSLQELAQHFQRARVEINSRLEKLCEKAMAEADSTGSLPSQT